MWRSSWGLGKGLLKKEGHFQQKEWQGHEPCSRSAHGVLGESAWGVNEPMLGKTCMFCGGSIARMSFKMWDLWFFQVWRGQLIRR